MAAPEKVVIKRFPKGADTNVKREFARELVKALDDMMVPPEVQFVVTTPEYIERLEEEARTAARRVEDLTTERDNAAEDVESLREAVADFERGILDRRELLEKMKDVPEYT